MSLKPLIAVCALLSGSVAVTPAIAQYGPKLPQTIIPTNTTAEVIDATDGYCPHNAPYCKALDNWYQESAPESPTHGWYFKPGAEICSVTPIASDCTDLDVADLA